MRFCLYLSVCLHVCLSIYLSTIRYQVRFCDAAEARGVTLERLRHPLLVWRAVGETPDDARMVPMDVRIPPRARAVVITGPNTGGKTVLLKTTHRALPHRATSTRRTADPMHRVWHRFSSRRSAWRR